MDVEVPDKTYFRIGEVSRILGVEPYVVRYWETEFKTVRPIRTGSEQRLYRKKDLLGLLTIKKLLYEDQYTIAGAKKKLVEVRTNQADIDNQSKDCRKMLIQVRDGLREIREILR
jgi:DNA-binding transcriptional MerR regulator